MEGQIEDKKKEAGEKKKLPRGCLIGCLLVIVLIVLSKMFPLEDQEKTKEETTTEVRKEEGAVKKVEEISDPREGLGYVAYKAAQRAVKENLQCPRTAKFPNFMGKDVITNYLGDGRYEVSSYVDAQNLYGAVVRLYYSVIVKTYGSTWEWEWVIESVDMQ